MKKFMLVLFYFFAFLKAHLIIEIIAVMTFIIKHTDDIIDKTFSAIKPITFTLPLPSKSTKVYE